MQKILSKLTILGLFLKVGIIIKIGKCNGSVARRFRQEPETTIIEIIHIWVHATSDKAEQHEAKLFRQYKHGDLPFRYDAGPLTKYGRSQGNTEVFSHDVIGGEPAPLLV